MSPDDCRVLKASAPAAVVHSPRNRAASASPALHARAVEGGGEDPDVVVDVLQLLPALEFHQHVRELLGPPGVDHADDERGHLRMLAKVPFDPVREYPRRDRVPAGRSGSRSACARLASRLCGSGASVGRHAPQYGVRLAAATVSRPPTRGTTNGNPSGIRLLRARPAAAMVSGAASGELSSQCCPSLGPGHQPQQAQRVQRRSENHVSPDAVEARDGRFHRVDGEHLPQLSKQPTPLRVVGALGLAQLPS